MTQWQRVLLAAYSAFFIYTILCLIFGDTGYMETARLRSYKMLLQENLTELESLNQVLESRAITLRSDKETLSVHSRELGYLKPEEGIILMKGFGDKQASYPMGRMLKWTRSVENRKPLFRGIALSVGIILFLLMTLFGHEISYPRELRHSLSRG